MTMDKHDKDELDHWLTTDPRDNEPDETECEHPYISWHGGQFSRGECQDCGEIISAPANPDTERVLRKLFDQWRDDIIRGEK